MPILDRRTNQFVEDVDSRVSVGIDFPFGRVPNGDGYFKTTKTTIDAIKTNIKLLLKTNQGERLFQPNLGMNLRDIIFEQMTEDSIVRIENNILDVFERWLPFVELRNIEIQNKDELNQVNINIEFNIKRTPNSLENVNVTFGGGGVSTGTGASSEGNVSGGTGGQSGPSAGGY
jgi:phage baseplate assembly protein W|tara:strand:- start:1015 stop:1536 length:522 start_codon:yes stop_codon:yes gene_type:complete